jgi:hypothetical protein
MGSEVIGICTYFDTGYLPRAIALYRSLARFHPELRWFMFCMDEQSARLVDEMSLPGVLVITRGQLDSADPELAAVADGRSVVEYYFTCTAAAMLHTLRLAPAVSTLFYVDADIGFFGPLDSMLQEMQQASVYITEHRFPHHLHELLVYGRFNVGVIGVRRCEQAIECLSTWRRQCIEWCFDRLEENRFGDQKYLDAWPGVYSGLKVSQHAGVNAAPWNKDNSQYTVADRQVFVNNQPLVCFHFQGLRLFSGGLVQPQAIDYGSLLSPELESLVYRPYLRWLLEAQRDCRVSVTSRRYSVSPRLLTIYRSRGSGKYWVQLFGRFWGLTYLNSLLLVTIVALRRLLGR